MINPKITVIMGIYNCETTLEESLDSLLNQTFQDFEVIMCDDGSKDNTYEVAKRFLVNNPEKFVLLKNLQNMGLNHTLNRCLQCAKGMYIARMDGDDISLPTRFEIQLKFLKDNPNVEIVSTAMIYFDESGDWGISKPKIEPQPQDLIYGTPFAHAPCMVKREAYIAVNGYTVNRKLLRVEDYHLWTKMYSKGFRGYNIQQPLYKMRDDKNAAQRRSFKFRLNDSYVKYLIVKKLNLPFRNYFYILRPIVVGLLPQKLYIHLHKKKLAN
ncbi:glycosyltransferase [Paenisporosarcina sp. TG-14]|uniref:glycosyltransferase n=1 Tax=Paenisporosarcina sp. TG-14 TaxID=1231057 RepID=UPI0002EDAF3A|nr:glycosyltransferase [Paenisporosarcina sp. TG-14]